MWMNEHEIDQAIERFAAHPVLGNAARIAGAATGRAKTTAKALVAPSIPTASTAAAMVR